MPRILSGSIGSISLVNLIMAMALAVVPIAALGGCRDRPDDPRGTATVSAPESSAVEGADAVRQPPRGPRPTADAIEASLDAAEGYLRSGQKENAEAILLKLVERAPNESRGHELLGQALAMHADATARQGDADEAHRLREQAYTHYARACTLRPDQAGLEHAAGVIAITANRTADALRHFERAATLDPSTTQYPLFAAQVLIGLDRVEEARVCLDRVLELDPLEPHAHASLAIVALESGEQDQALAHAAEACRLAPRDAALRVSEARVLRRTGDARTALERLLALPLEERVQFGVTTELGACARASDRVDLTLNAWAECFRADPRGPEAHRAAARAGLAALDLDRRDEARGWLEQARIFGRADLDIRTLGRRLQE